MIIKNFSSLSTSKTRKDSLEIISSGIEAVLTKPSIYRQIKLSGNILKIQNKTWNLSKYERIFVFGAGKASSDMAEAIEKILDSRITSGLVIDTKKGNFSRIKSVVGTHPLTSEKNIGATKKIISFLEGCNDKDLIIFLISGGGSALMEYPRISLEKLIDVNKLLLKKGASIKEINTIRKHLSFTKGGQLASIASNSEIITLIISDVLGNDLNIIASGPTINDPTTIKDAENICLKYSLSNLPFVETPKTKIKNVSNILLVTNSLAVNAMKNKASSLGYKTKILSTTLSGEAKDLGKKFSSMIKNNTAIIACGESTVHVKGKGKGGRNQELVLSASRFIKNGVVVSCSSDGVDFITDAAGAIADETTKTIAEKKGFNIEKFLSNNDSYNILKNLNCVIKTGKTGTNIGDLFLVLGNK